MKRVLLAIENDVKFPYSTEKFICHYKQEFEGCEVIEFNRFSSKKKEEIIDAVSRCTDIVVQSFLINGSEYQLEDMALLLAKIKQTKNVYINVGYKENVEEKLIGLLTDAEIIGILHHNIFRFEADSESKETYPILFEGVIKEYYKAKSKKASKALFIEFYKETARQRTIGKKVRVLRCFASGKAFQNLPIGEVVDVLDCVELQEDKTNTRGVWIWGNGEPIMLVNDIAKPEYEVVGKLNIDEVLNEILKATSISPKTLNEIECEGLKRYLETIDFSDLPNLMCEKLGVERRGNREKIRNIIEKNLVE